MQIQAEHGRKIANLPCPRGEDASYIRIVFKHRRKTVLNYDADLKVRACLLQQPQSGSSQHAIAERTQPDNRNAAAGVEPIEGVCLQGHAKSPIRLTPPASIVDR